MKRIALKTCNRRGSQYVEAGIALPVVILAVMLLLRLFIFYIQILSTGVQEHKKAMDEWDSYQGSAVRVYESEERVNMLAGGLLFNDAGKTIKTKSYLINEDGMVRSHEALD